MRNKQVKKLRRIARQDFREERNNVAERTMTKFFTETIKPKPAWIPGKVWLWLLRRFLNF